MELQWRYRAAKLGSVSTGLLTALKQLKECTIHVEGLWGSGPKAFKVKNGGAEKGNLQVGWGE